MMTYLTFRYPGVSWDLAAFRTPGPTTDSVTVCFTNGAFQRGDDFGVAEAEVVRNEDDVVVRLLVDPSMITTGMDAIERYEEELREAQAGVGSYRVVPQPDIEIVFGEA